MSNINFELNLNKHPKDVPNRALVSATNVQLSNDFSCLQNEFCIKENNELKSDIGDKYIAGYIPCNKEFILFVAPKTWKTDLLSSKGITIDIYRFREQGELKDEKGYWKDNIHRNSFDSAEWKIVYNKFLWHGGKLKGTFTYNIKSQLIIAIAESDSYTGELVPLKTINLGTWDDNTESVNTDLNLEDSQLSLNPEIKIPAITNYNYVNGLSYKGWYSFFVRYKINSIDYTKWYHVGFPILIDELEKVQLFNYYIKGNLCPPKNSISDSVKANKQPFDYIGNSIKDYISSGSNTCNKTIELFIDHKNNKFSKYQIGIIQSTKDDNRAFKTLDIDIFTTNFLLDFASLEEYDITTLLFEQYNYYDVKNIINYKNRLYISNYNESFIKNTKISDLSNSLYIQINRKEFEYKRTSDSQSIIDLCIYKDLQNNYVDIPSGTSSGRIQFEYNIDGDYINNDSLLFNGNIYYKKGLHDSEVNGVSKQLNATLIEIFDPKSMGLSSGNATVTDKIDDTTITFVISFNYNITESTKISNSPEEYHIKGSCNGTITVIKSQLEPFTTTPEDNYHNRLKNTTLIPGETYNFYVHFVNKYGEYTDGIKIKGVSRFNKNGKLKTYSKNNNDGSITIDGTPKDKYIEANKSCYLYYPQLIIDNNILKENLSNNLNDYVGFFLTYEKFQKTKQFCGILSRYDFYYKNNGLYGSETRTGYKNYEKHLKFSGKADNNGKYKFRFYCTDIDTLNNIELNFVKLRVEAKGFPAIIVHNTNDINNTDYDDTITESQAVIFSEIKEYDILNAHYVGAHNFSKENEYNGGYIEIEFKDVDAFLNDMGIPKYDTINESDYNFSNFIFKVVLFADTKNLYLSENKTLIKFTNTYYFDEMNFNNSNDDEFINSEKISLLLGLNGFCTFNTALIYNNNKVVLNPGYNLLLTGKYKSYIDSSEFRQDAKTVDTNIESEIALPFVANIMYIDYNNYPYESRRFKTLPEIISIRTQSISDSVSQSIFTFRHATIVQPMNSIDLFENKLGSQDNNIRKTYINFTNAFVTAFNKRIIRSNPIADESFENSWRTFNPESYKDITENKGNITNLIALGTTFLVHTEHSLFMFDRDNTIQNGADGIMQLAMPDVFDIDYKEVFASHLGACGLQDSDAWILDEFGYIFYDNDAHKFYKFGSKKIEDITSSITQFIDKVKPYSIRFANDSESNRILINLLYLNKEFNTNEQTLSFNYKINKWISFHDYCFDRAFNTKQMLYLIIDREQKYNEVNNIYSQLYMINRQNLDNPNIEVIKNGIYNQFDNIRDLNHINDLYLSNISIMVNDSYELIKTLEFITWKLYKINYNIENNNNSRESIKVPYSGYQLQIYNDNIDSGIIDISVDDVKNKSIMDYKKPWWEYDNWNFNYFRDISKHNKKLANFMSRLYGNYFIISIWFGNNIERCEFETLTCKLINNKTV